jgi:hypothetical protein
MALAPEPRLCDRQNAVHVLHGVPVAHRRPSAAVDQRRRKASAMRDGVPLLPEQTANPMLCAMHGQAYLAGTSLELIAGEYPKIICIRSQQGHLG